MKFSPISVLSQIQNLVSKTIYRAISIILYPCCDLTGEAEVFCNDDNTTYTLVITTNENIAFLGKGVAGITIDGLAFTGVVTEPNTITVDLVTGVTPGNSNVYVSVLLPTNTDSNMGVFKSFTVNSVVFPSCV